MSVDLAHFFFTLWRLSDPTDRDVFPSGGIIKRLSAQVTSLFFKKLHHFSLVWTHLSWSWKHEGMFSLPLQRAAKGEMRGKWFKCLPQCKHQITGAWPKLIRSETLKFSLSDCPEGMRVTSQHPFGRSPLFVHISVVNVTDGIEAFSREGKQTCLAVLENSNTVLRPCFVSRVEVIWPC